MNIIFTFLFVGFKLSDYRNILKHLKSVSFGIHLCKFLILTVRFPDHVTQCLSIHPSVHPSSINFHILYHWELALTLNFAKVDVIWTLKIRAETVLLV